MTRAAVNVVCDSAGPLKCYTLAWLHVRICPAKEMDVIVIESEAFYRLIQEVVDRVAKPQEKCQLPRSSAIHSWV